MKTPEDILIEIEERIMRETELLEEEVADNAQSHYVAVLRGSLLLLQELKEWILE